MAATLMIDPPSPFATEAEHLAFLKSYEKINLPEAHRAVTQVRQQLKERVFDLSRYPKD